MDKIRILLKKTIEFLEKISAKIKNKSADCACEESEKIKNKSADCACKESEKIDK